ncbi:hypothetical protein TH53_02905 [Pedobacter lusitanus]|uniref:AsmA-like C-terminal domain-containing protein n=1 Tax=Pedobacter lusitanus TaxID=1503925 RepID=A0A0D0G165_9SPHI|nr:DUF748 domain-containing protein [Pedobacter lusitanus]KIO78539.1 hypothetical protein TH53_02905 [Pedobacter lusitanus]
MTDKRSGSKKLWKWITAIIITLFVIIGGASLYLSLSWKPVLTKKIKEVVYRGSGHLYQIDFKDIQLNLLSGSVTVDSIFLRPDTAIFAQRKKAGTAPTHLFQVKLARLKLRHIRILQVYFQQKIAMNDIILENPSINMIYNKVYKKADTAKAGRSLYQLISGTLKSVHIKGIKIADADFDYVNGSTSLVLNSVKHLNVQIRDFRLDARSESDTTRFYYTKDVFFELAGYHAVSKDKLYTMKADTITGSATGKKINIKGFKVIPMYPDLAFSRKLKIQKDRYDLVFGQVSFSGVDFMKFNTDRVIHAKALEIKNTEARIFMNREMPPGKGNKGRNFPHVALQRLPVPVTIDTLKFKKVNVAYTEYNPMSQKRGTVNIDQLNGHILNVTNDSLSRVKNHYAAADLHAQLIKAAQLHILINFDLSSKNGAFTFKGNIGKLDMTSLNPLSRPLGLVEIETGQIQKIDFEAKASEQGSEGVMQLYYNQLKIKLLKEGEEGKPAHQKGLLSFLANTLIIKDANPSKGEAVRTARIHYERPPGASFFNLLWKSVYTGMRETIGLGIIPMKSPEETRKAVVKKMEDRKEKKEQKKQQKQGEKRND